MLKLLFRSIFALLICILLPIILSADNTTLEKSFLDKARKSKTDDHSAHTVDKTSQQTPQEIYLQQPGSDTNSLEHSTLSLIRTGKEEKTSSNKTAANPAAPTHTAVDTVSHDHPANEDKPVASTAVKHPQFKKTPAPQKEPGHNVKWIDSSTRNFSIKVEPQTSGIMTPNLGMKFETVHQVLSKNISWMMSGKAKVYVYQNRQSFLRNEPVASSWSGAFFSPDEGRIVMYDEPNNTSKMIEQFTHELTHLFVEEFYNPPSESYKLEPPIWLNEGLAVNMEDIATSTKGGVWANDLVVINIISQAEKLKLLSRLKNKQGFTAAEKRAAAQNMVSMKTVSFVKFADFIKSNSYDIAEQKGDIENWYFQAYAMVRFLFRTKNSTYPDKRMQFEQFTKLLRTFEDKKDANGKVVHDANGRIVKKRMSTEAALRKAYGFRNINDFETKFWKWLIQMQTQERQKLKAGLDKR